MTKLAFGRFYTDLLEAMTISPFWILMSKRVFAFSESLTSLAGALISLIISGLIPLILAIKLRSYHIVVLL